MSAEQPPDDPLGLDAADREIRINELTEQLHAMGMESLHTAEECPPEIHEQFLNSIMAYESAPVGSHFDRLEKAGIALPAPETLDDTALTAKLWEVIRALADRDTFLHHTNHLSDRRLYEGLWRETLREETAMFPPGSGWNNHIDLIGSGSDEDIQIGLRYYDDDEHRARWARDFPDDVIPPHEDPPCDRDRLLPAPANDIPPMIEGDGVYDFDDDDPGDAAGSIDGPEETR